MMEGAALNDKTCIIIAGPTASGKTALALQLAQHFGTAIISADSRQCFREMTIGTAKPTAAELTAVPHYFINTHSIADTVNAAVFEQYALQAVNEIFQRHHVAVMAGGTGLYIKAFCQGLDDIPEIPGELKKQLALQYEAGGINWLRRQVQAHDPLYWSSGEVQNPSRLLRALEVKLATGKSIRSFQLGQQRQRPFKIVKLAVNQPRNVLYERINERVLHMMQAGLLEEVRQLWPMRSLKALQTVGYSELFGFLDGLYSLPRAIELMQQNTRHYAKRQVTWFGKDPAIKWLQKNTVAEVLAALHNAAE